FLPQDRVCAFAGMSPIQLLEETQRAVGDPQLSQQHAFLKDQQDALATLHATLVSHEEQLGKLQQANAQVEVDVEKVQRREAILKEVALMKKKVPWLKYERMKRHVREMEVAVEARLKERDDLQTQVMAARDPLVALKESRGGFASLVAKIGRENEARERKLRELSEESDQLVQQAVERQRDVLEAKKKAESREQRLAKAQADLQQLEAQLAALPEVKPPKAAVDPLAKRGRELRMQAGEKEREGRQLEQQMSALREQMGRVERRINEVANSRNRRIERAGDRELKQACEWLDHNRAQCKGAVYGPILAEVRRSFERCDAVLRVSRFLSRLKNRYPFVPLPSILLPPAPSFLPPSLPPFFLTLTSSYSSTSTLSSSVPSLFLSPSLLPRALPPTAAAPRCHAPIGRGVQRGPSGAQCAQPAVAALPLRECCLLTAFVELQERANAVRREQRALEAEAAQCERQRDEIVNEYHGQKKQRTNLQDRIVQKRRLVEESGQSENMEEVERRARVDIAVSMERQLGNAKKTHVSAACYLQMLCIFTQQKGGAEGAGGHCCQHGEAAGQCQEDTCECLPPTAREGAVE
ncbi:unnamed protein product, partial [Closterium sp. NIES-54]